MKNQSFITMCAFERIEKGIVFNMNKLKMFFKLFIILVSIFFINCYTNIFNVYAYGTNEQVKQYRTSKFDILDTISLIFQDELYFDGENSNVSQEQKNFNNNIVLGISIFLIVYWIILLLIFEKEDIYNYTYENIDDIETLKKYNPLIAGCLTDNREVLPRDILAVILNLIRKDYINLKMIPNLKNGKENYIYMISENKSKIENLDRIESYILSWIFGFYEEKEVDLLKKMKELSKRKDFLKKLNNLNNLAKTELHTIGANIPKVPLLLRITNIFVFIFTIFVSTIHIINNGINIQIYQSTIWLFLLITSIVIFIIPIIALGIHLILMLIILLKKFIKSTAEKYSGKKIVEMSALIILFTFLIIAIIYAVVPNKYICLDILMMSISFLIMRTDNLMTKHSKEILNDYYALNEIKYRIENYSLIKDEQINYIKIWDEYLIYAVTFGIPISIVNKLKSNYKENEDLAYLAKCENLYYICKAYLEVMWDMKFKKGLNIFSVENPFKQE